MNAVSTDATAKAGNAGLPGKGGAAKCDLWKEQGKGCSTKATEVGPLPNSTRTPCPEHI